MSNHPLIYDLFWRILRKQSLRAVRLAGAVGVHAVAHAGVALSAGLFARAIVSPGQTGWLNELGPVVRVLTTNAGVSAFVLVGLILVVVKGASAVMIAHDEAMLATEAGKTCRAQCVGGLMSAGSSWGEPETLARVAEGSGTAQDAILRGPLAAGRAVAQLVPLACALILVSPRLALVGISGLILFAVLLSRLRNLGRRRERNQQRLSEVLHGSVNELTKNLDLWRTYGAGSRVTEAIHRAECLAQQARARTDASRAAVSNLNEALGALALFGCVVVAPRLEVSLGDGRLLAFAFVFFMAYRPLRDLGDARGWIVRGEAALESLAACVGPVATNLMEGSARPAWARSTLRARRLGVLGRGPRTSFKLGPGEALALVGPTGSGKTTLARAMLGLEPSVGELSYGRTNLTLAGVGPGERPFAWVPQDAPLVTDDLLGNVALTGTDRPSAEKALRLMDGGKLLARVGDAIIGPGGRPLSGGERRLVALARALVTNLPVLILDEPCAGLDAAAAEEVLAALARVKSARILLLITHQPAVAAIADRQLIVGANSDDPSPGAAPEAVSKLN